MEDRRIGDLLVDAGVITRDALEEALAKKPVLGERRVLSELFELGLANERPLAEVLAKRVGAPVAVLSECVVDLAVVRFLPADVVRRHKALPIAADQNTLTVVAADPDAPGVRQELAFASGRRVVPLIGIQSILERAIDDVLAFAESNENKMWRGKSATSEGPHTAIARHVPAIALAEADEIARQIIDALDSSKFPKADGAPKKPQPEVVGALRLRQMVIEQKVDAIVVEERVRSRSDPALRAIRIDDSNADAPENASDDPVVLVVDDDDAVRMMLTKSLEHDGLTVVTAKDGDEAVTQLRLLRPKVVLLDAMLPKVHGFEICAALKRSRLRDIPVVMISAIYRGVDQAREIQEVHGADFFVEKPFELQYVRKLVADLLQRPQEAKPKHELSVRLIDDAKKAFEDHAAHGDLVKADVDLQLWSSLDPFDGRAWLERGNLCALKGDLTGAMSAFEAAVVYDSGLLLAHLGLAVVYEQLGFSKRARATWQKARELAPDDATRASIEKRLA
jgi:CheY-like chemotaxis protein